jgi:hypothetical protein
MLGPMDITPAALEDEFSLPTAATRLDFLSRRDTGETTLNRVADDDDWTSAFRVDATSLDMSEALELLALGEVIARKAHGSRLIGLRAALRGGADWEQIGAALGRSPRAAWETYLSLVEAGLEGEDAEAARELAGSRPR